MTFAKLISSGFVFSIGRRICLRRLSYREKEVTDLIHLNSTSHQSILAQYLVLNSCIWIALFQRPYYIETASG
ncbi:MAG TPA: hypothetical protein DEA96_08550 [Leptospiraceae bacterium]|nr:hypothetical protein [Spirochaetaceae bacterium]HBS04999.1 hypothetical protein [Leptospiraceae bacterium]